MAEKPRTLEDLKSGRWMRAPGWREGRKFRWDGSRFVGPFGCMADLLTPYEFLDLEFIPEPGEADKREMARPDPPMDAVTVALFAWLIDTYGEADQLRQAVEECSEFVVAWAKWRRNAGRTGPRLSSDWFNDLIEEAADVAIMMDQVRQMEPRRFDAVKAHKLERLRLRAERRGFRFPEASRG